MVETPWADIWVTPADWAEAFEAADPGTPHNEARDQVWEELLTILIDGYEDEDVSADLLRRSLLQNEELIRTFSRAWTLIEAADLVGDLWSVPAYLRRCAPWLTPDEVQKLRREDAQAWTVSDLPLLDAARQRLGDPETSRRRAPAPSGCRRRTGVHGPGCRRPDRGRRRRGRPRDGAAPTRPARRPGRRSRTAEHRLGPSRGPVRAHRRGRGSGADRRRVADAAAPLPLRASRSSATAPSQHGFTESVAERLERIGLDNIDLATLSINYRTPEEVMAEAEPVIRAVFPAANVPIHPQWSPRCPRTDIRPALDPRHWLATHADGIACVIDAHGIEDDTFNATSRVRRLTPNTRRASSSTSSSSSTQTRLERHRRNRHRSRRPLCRDDPRPSNSSSSRAPDTENRARARQKALKHTLRLVKTLGHGSGFVRRRAGPASGSGTASGTRSLRCYRRQPRTVA